MAEAAVSSVVQLLGDKLIQEATFLYGVGDQVESIQRELMRMKCFLKDADAKEKGDERIRNWVREIRDVAYEAEDVIDTFLCKTAWQRRMCFVKRYAFFFNGLIVRHKVGKEIKRIKLKICEISESRSTYGIRSIDELGETSVMNEGLRERRQTSPLLSEPHIISLEEEAKTLVGRLVGQQPRRCVISIVGMGGLGKTTLAKKIYNNNGVKNHFECRAWVCVSQQRNIVEILRDIANGIVMNISEDELKNVNISKDELKSMNKKDLEEKLNTILNKKMYLVVIDDIWDTQAWDDLKTSLPDGKKGSRVLLTTRIRDVALYADQVFPPYMLRLLSDDESWELFLKKVFPTVNDVANCPSELEAVGKEIVARCGGLPLAIVVIGGVLSVKEKSESAWLMVLHTVNWQLSQGPNPCLEILALSYNDLPHYLKLCFLYFGLFPEDHAIPAKDLIHMWVAEGFIQVRGEETLEEAAEECMEELIQRSMIQAKRRLISGSVKTCHIHDLMRDVAISKGKEDKFLDIHGDVYFVSPTRARRLAIHRSMEEYMSLNHSTPHLRTLLCFFQEREFIEKGEWRHFLEDLKLLRVLNLNIGDAYVVATVIPNEINKLIHLRYFNLGHPTSFFGTDLNISALHNLQTLDLRNIEICSICSSIWKMKQLRHLYLDNGIRIEPPQRADDISLGNLQTLKTIGGDGSSRLDYLVKLISLRKLRIKGEIRARNNRGLADGTVTLESMRSLSWDCEYRHLERSHLRMMLPWYPHLRKLRLQGILHKLPDIHEFPQKLVKLSLSHTQLHEDPMAMLQKLPNLQILFLEKSHVAVEMVCSTGGFPRLEYLTLQEEWTLRKWRVEEGTMPSLRYLKIDECSKLEMLPDGLRGLTNLTQLFIHMPWDFNKARLREDEGADWDKIKHIPSITIERYY